MNPIAYATCVLTALGSPDDDGGRAGLLAQVCGDDRQCVAVLAVLWSLETAQTFALHPKSRGSCGPVQVWARDRARCRALEVPAYGLAEGWRIWRIKLKAARGKVARAFEFYNGAPQRLRYSKHAMRLLKRTEQCHD